MKFIKACAECNVVFEIRLHEPISDKYDSIINDEVTSSEIEFCPICGSEAYDEKDVCEDDLGI